MRGVECETSELQGEKMSDQQISSRLREIASGPKKTETARLRDIFDDVEHALMRKTQSEVLSILHEGGFKFTEAGFRYSLAKIRRERGTGRMAKKKGDKQQEPPTQNQPRPQKLVESESAPENTETTEATPQYTTEKERRQAEAKRIAETYTGGNGDESTNISKYI